MSEPINRPKAETETLVEESEERRDYRLEFITSWMLQPVYPMPQPRKQ